MRPVSGLLIVVIIAAIAAPARGLAFADETLLPHNGVAGQPYIFELHGRAGGPPYSYKIDSGSLPPGLTMTRRGLISGVPSKAGTFSFWANLADNYKAHSQREIKIEITPPPAGKPPPKDPNSFVKPGWTLTFCDDFDAKEIDPYRWMARYRGNTALPPAYAIEGGTLHLRMEKDAPPVRSDNLGRVSSIETGGAWNQFAQEYGLFEVRARGVSGSGFSASVVLLPVDQLYKKLRPDGGTRATANEARAITLFEQLGKDPKSADFNAIFGGGKEGEHDDAKHVEFPVDLSADFHVYAVMWNPNSLMWTVDGKEVHHSNHPPRSPFIIALNFFESEQLGKSPVDHSLPLPREFQIDYVRAYTRSDQKASLK